jgi:iron complex outermembrane receptor protein
MRDPLGICDLESARKCPRTGRRLLRSWRIPLSIALTSLIWGVAPASSESDVTAPTTETEIEPAAEAEPPKDESFKGVEEMTVEARRRSENLQKIGESVTSFSSSDLLDRGLTNFNDLQYNVPSLFSGGGLTKITLRGVGSEIVGPGIDPGFAVHVNGVFSARESTGLINYFDIDRVDVLRGPQGTLWGRNSTGGAVNIVTKKAEHEFSVSADAEYGWFDSGANGILLRGVLNMPLVEDKLALRVALLTTFDDGQMEIRSEENSQEISKADSGTLRASLRWEPHEDVTVDLVGSWLRSDGSGGGVKFQGNYETPPPPNFEGSGAGYDFTGALRNPNDPYRGSADEPQRSDTTVYTASLLVAWEAEDFKLDSISGYQSTDFFIHRDQDTSSLPISVLELTDKSRQISQEFIINSTWDKSFDYTIGTIYQYDWTPQTLIDVANSQDTALATGILLPPALPPLPGLPDGLSLNDLCPAPFILAPGCPPIKQRGDPYEDFIHALAEVDNHVFGLYTNLSWEIFEDLTLSAGGRFSYTYRDWNDKTVAQSYIQLFGAPNPFGVQILQLGVHLDEDWMAGTWKLGAEYEVTETNLLWVSAGTGSRAGGFNFGEEDSFDSEEILSFEAGIKNSFFDNRLVLNIAGFYYDWDDPQIGATEDGLPITRNAPSAVSYGIEIDWFARPVENLSINGSFGWLEAYYDEDYFDGDNTLRDFTQLSPADQVTQINLNDNRLPRSPRFTVSLGAQYTFDIGRWGTLIPRVDSYYRDEVAFRQYSNDKDVAPGYTRTDVRLTWRSETETFWAEIFVRNLENEATKTNQQILASIYRTHSIDTPLNGGFRVGYNY